MVYVIETCIVHAVSIQFLNAKADVDAPMQESKQGIVTIKAVFCGLCCLNSVSFIDLCT